MCLHIKKGQPLKKTLTFGVMHISIAFMITYLITGSVIAGGVMALLEPTVNTVMFYIHEKLSHRKEAKNLLLGIETKVNHFIKSIKFGAIHILVAFIIGYLVTNSFVFSSIIAFLEPSVNTVFLYFHEKIWNHLDKKAIAEFNMNQGHQAISE